MSYGLSDAVIQAIQHVFSQHVEVEKAVLYGSRAKGNYRVGSDIDITLFGPAIHLTVLHNIENELDDLCLPYKIDISIFHQIQNPDLVDHIERVGKVIFRSNSI